ncbi:MAG: hypothetical protein GX061_04260 [Eubacteriaceae bacterium]|nr:hypothetical protein [Eubacteriaceae bacterium]
MSNNSKFYLLRVDDDDYYGFILAMIFTVFVLGAYFLTRYIDAIVYYSSRYYVALVAAILIISALIVKPGRGFIPVLSVGVAFGIYVAYVPRLFTWLNTNEALNIAKFLLGLASFWIPAMVCAGLLRMIGANSGADTLAHIAVYCIAVGLLIILGLTFIKATCGKYANDFAGSFFTLLGFYLFSLIYILINLLPMSLCIKIYSH